MLSVSITSLLQLTRMGLLAGFLHISKSLLGIAAGFGLASPCSDQELISVVAHRSDTFWKTRPDDGVKWSHWSHL